MAAAATTNSASANKNGKSASSSLFNAYLNSRSPRSYLNAQIINIGTLPNDTSSSQSPTTATATNNNHFMTSSKSETTHYEKIDLERMKSNFTAQTKSNNNHYGQQQQNHVKSAARRDYSKSLDSMKVILPNLNAVHRGNAPLRGLAFREAKQRIDLASLNEMESNGHLDVIYLRSKTTTMYNEPPPLPRAKTTTKSSMAMERSETKTSNHLLDLAVAKCSPAQSNNETTTYNNNNNNNNQQQQEQKKPYKQMLKGLKKGVTTKIIASNASSETIENSAQHHQQQSKSNYTEQLLMADVLVDNDDNRIKQQQQQQQRFKKKLNRSKTTLNEIEKKNLDDLKALTASLKINSNIMMKLISKRQQFNSIKVLKIKGAQMETLPRATRREKTTLGVLQSHHHGDDELASSAKTRSKYAIRTPNHTIATSPFTNSPSRVTRRRSTESGSYYRVNAKQTTTASVFSDDEEANGANDANDGEQQQPNQPSIGLENNNYNQHNNAPTEEIN